MFQVGDKVECIREQVASGKRMPVGYVGVVTCVAGTALTVDDWTGREGGPVMFDEAFKLVERASKKPTKVKAKRIKIPCYAVIKGAKVVYTTSDREDARAVKAARGGKACGVSIYKMAAEKEIR